MFEISDKELKKITKNLHEVSKNAYPKAVRSTLDRMAYLTHGQYKKNIKNTFIVRNSRSNIILKSLHYEKCPNTLDISQMSAHAGQQAQTYGKATDQLKKQEFGETLKSSRNHIAKPSKFARGGNYKRVVMQENYMSQIKVSRISDLVEYPAENEFKEFRQAIAYAKRHPDKIINFLPSEKSYLGINGIFRLDGSKDKTAEPLYSLKGKTQKLEKRPTLQPAAKTISAKSGEVFKHEAQRRIEKELFKGLKNT